MQEWLLARYPQARVKLGLTSNPNASINQPPVDVIPTVNIRHHAQLSAIPTRPVNIKTDTHYHVAVTPTSSSFLIILNPPPLFLIC